MRFGMFAEKPTPSKGIELFEVRYNKQNQAIDQKELAIPPHMLSYLIRGDYYKGEIESCAQHLYQLAGASKAINIYKVTIREKIKTEELIYTYPNE